MSNAQPTSIAPFNVRGIKTEQAGPRLLVLGAVHGNEICGPRAIERVLAEFESKKLNLLRGGVSFVPITNPKAYEQRQREGDRNLNRNLGPSEHPQDFEDRIAGTLADDLAAAGPGHAVLIDGSAGFAPLAAHARDEFPLIGSLIAPYLVGDDHFHTHVYLQYFLGEFSDLRLSDDAAILAHNALVLASTCGVRPRVVRSHYGLYLVDNVIVVRFHGSESRSCSDAAPNP